MKNTFEFFFIERSRDAVCSTYKIAAQTHAMICQFCQLRKWPPAHMPEHVYRPVRPLVLIYNSILESKLFNHDKHYMAATMDVKFDISTDLHSFWAQQSLITKTPCSPYERGLFVLLACSQEIRKKRLFQLLNSNGKVSGK